MGVVRDAYRQGKPYLFWVNRKDPFLVSMQSTAHNGRVAIVDIASQGLSGAPMIVKFILARASHIASWYAMVNNDPFLTTALSSNFDTGHKVIFSREKPLQYENMILRDGNVDIGQSLPSGFDLWEGILNLIIVE